MPEMTPEELEQKRQELSALLNKVSTGKAPAQTEAEQDISNLDRWGQQSPELLQNLGNPDFQPTPSDRALATTWAKQDPELFNSLIPDVQEPEAPIIAPSLPQWFWVAMIGGWVAITVIVGAAIFGVVAGGGEKVEIAPQPAISQVTPTPSPTPSPEPTQEPALPNEPDAPPDATHRVIGNPGDILNVRDHHGNVMGSIPVGAYVKVTGYTGDRDWAITEYQGLAAFLWAEHLEPLNSDRTGQTR